MSPKDAILCVDDEALILKALRRALESRLGYRFTIETAENGAEALDLIDTLHRRDAAVRVVISDAMMPVMDGYELLSRLHQDRPEIHKILLTGRGEPAKIERLFADSGLVAALDKPWNNRELCALIERTVPEPSYP